MGKDKRGGRGKQTIRAGRVSTRGATEKKDWASKHAHLFPSQPRNFDIGRDVQHKKNVGRFVKWPQYIRLQRQRAILKKRLKIPPAIAQFTNTLEKNTASALFKLLYAYRPETRQAKQARLRAAAEANIEGKEAKNERKNVLKFGLNHVTTLVERKQAKLVLIAHDVDPIELVVWLPALCRKMGIPYAIVKGKARLGHLVHKKTASVVAVTGVKQADNAKLAQIVNSVQTKYSSPHTKWGGMIMGTKTKAVLAKRLKAKALSERQ
jgi:large subunit ribosomal protein L7Ae